MVPAWELIRKPACPTLVTCTNAFLGCIGVTAFQPPSLARGRIRGVIEGLPQPPVVVDTCRVGLRTVGVEKLRLPVAAGIVPAQRERRHRQVGPPVGHTEFAEIDMSATAAVVIDRWWLA